MAISSTVLTGSPANIYVSSGDTVVSVMYFCNTANTSCSFNLYALSSPADTANASTIIYNSVQLAGNDTFVVDMEKLVLANNNILQANATGNITATISYVGI